MNEEVMQTVARFIEQLHLLTRPQLHIVSNFDKRLQVVSQNQVKLFYVVTLAREYREQEDSKTLEQIKTRARELIREILPQFKATLASEEEGANEVNLQKEQETISHEISIFHEEIEALRRDRDLLQHISAPSKAKIAELLREFNEAAQKLSKEQDIVDRLKDIMSRLSKMIAVQKSIVRNLQDALTSLSNGNLTMESRGVKQKAEDVLWSASKQLFNALKTEKKDIIEPLNKLLKRKIDAHTYVNELVSRKHKPGMGSIIKSVLSPSTFFQKVAVRRYGSQITARDIDNDLHKLTLPSEVYLYVSLLAKHAELLSPQALKRLAPFLEVYAEKSRKIEAKAAETKIDPLFAIHDIPIVDKQELLAKIDAAISRSMRLKTPVTIIMLDIDHFKKINDTYGHLAGDMTIADVGAICVQYARRPDDFVGRYGGEELTVVLPGSTKQDGITVAERIRKKIEQHVMDYQSRKINITISGGIAEFPVDLASTGGQFPDPSTVSVKKLREELIEVADRLLYGAKKGGRNQIQLKTAA